MDAAGAGRTVNKIAARAVLHHGLHGAERLSQPARLSRRAAPSRNHLDASLQQAQSRVNGALGSRFVHNLVPPAHPLRVHMALDVWLIAHMRCTYLTATRPPQATRMFTVIQPCGTALEHCTGDDTWNPNRCCLRLHQRLPVACKPIENCLAWLKSIVPNKRLGTQSGIHRNCTGN